jgi:chromosome segregation ATPase
MSTHPNSENDLDRTDELPRLDVAEYEAKLAAEANDTLASTDTWAVESIREAEATQQSDTAALGRFARNRAAPEPTRTNDVTLDATRILGRISQLESELAAAKSYQAELQAKFDRLTTEFNTKEKEVRALSADNARLTEQRALVTDRIHTLERQLKDDTAQFERDLAQQIDTRTSEQTAATKARLALEGQVAELTSLAARLREDNSRLDDETQAASRLAKTQVELIEQFRQRLSAEEKNAAQLARHLAAKIAEHASVDHELERRAAKIRGLEDTQDDLDTEIDELELERDTLTAKLQAASHQLAAEQDTVHDRDAAIAERDARIAQLEKELQAAKAAIASLTDERDQALRTLAAEREAQSQAQLALTARAQEIDQLHGSSEQLHARIAALQQELSSAQSAGNEHQAKAQDLERALTESQLRREILADEIQSARTRLQQLESEAKQAVVVRETLDHKSGELQRTHELLAAVQRELDEVRSNLVTKHSELAEREEALRTAHEVVADLRKLTDELQRTTDDATRRMSEMQDRDRQREDSVLANAADLAAARRQLGQQLAAVQSMEQAIRARDTLTERLRGELQTSQDERAIIAGQLEKSRARNKSMAREIFSRDNQIVSLKADLAVHAETLAAIRQDVNRASTTAELAVDHGDRVLEPVDHDGDLIVLNRKTMTIGRTSDNDICIPSKLVSRNHARLLVGPNAVILEDAGSTNGCFVNEVQVKQQLMRDGDVLSIGDLKYRLRSRPDNATRIRDNVIPFGDGRHND